MNRPERNSNRRGDPSRQSGPNPLERPAPCSIEAEQCLLASMLLNPKRTCDDIASTVTEADFYDEANRILFSQMMKLHNENQNIDVKLLTTKLKKEGLLEKIGGLPYLGQLAEMVPHAAHAVDYARLVSDQSTRRALIEIATNILHDSYDSPAETKELINNAEEQVFSVIDRRNASSIQSFDKALVNALERIYARSKGEHTFAGVSSGFPDVDHLMGGFHPNELIVLAARPGMGKTALAINIAKSVAIDERKPVLFVSLEMSSNELIDRLLCSVTEVNGHSLRNGTISNKDRDRLMATASQISSAPFYVDDSHSRTIVDIAAGARRVKRANGDTLGLLVVDYLQLIEPDNPRDPRQEQVAKITRRLKVLSKELKTPVLCLAQLNRQTEVSRDNKPRLSHLRESGAIEQDADAVLFVHREEYFQMSEDERRDFEGKAELIIAKQRNGPTGQVDLLWQKSYMRFVSPARHEYGELGEPQEVHGW